MKLFSRYFLSLTLILGNLLPYKLSYADTSAAKLLMSPIDIFSSDLNRDALYFQNSNGQRVVNEYRLLGFSHFPDITHEGFKKALLNYNFLLTTSSEKLATSSKYTKLMKTEFGRMQLFRMYQGAFSALSVVTDQNLTAKYEPKVRQIYTDIANEKLFGDEKDPKVLSEKRQLELNRRLMSEFSEVERHKAFGRIKVAQKLLNNPIQRATYNFKNGVTAASVPPAKASFNRLNQWRNLGGRTIIRVQDPFGKDIDISWPKTADPAEKVTAKDLMNSVKSGTIETGKLGLAFLIIMFGAAELKMLWDYEANPRRFEETLDQTMSWAMPLSIGSFFVGGAATKSTLDYLNIARQSRANLNALVQNRTLFTNNPTLRSKFIQANMSAMASNSFLSRATSNSGLVGGFFISQLVYQYVNKLESCRKMVSLKHGDYTKFERDRIEKACEQTFSEITYELTTNPQTWMSLTALLSAKAILTFGMSKLQMSKYAIFDKPAQKTAFEAVSPKSFAHKVRIVARGISAPLVSTVVGFIVFSLIFEAVMSGLSWGVEKLTLDIPASKMAEDLRSLFKMYQDSGWDMNKLCDDRRLLEGGLLDYLKPLLFWQKTNRCGDELVNAFLENHKNLNASWRSNLMAPVNTAISKWMEYTFKATNLQHASYVFYKDIAEQIKAQRNSGRKVVINRVLNEQTGHMEALGHVNTHLYNHPLPLFRSEPYFGWSYNLKENSNFDEVFYPVYDGQVTTWSERYDSQYGVQDFNQRLQIFKMEVLPVVIKKLEDRLFVIKNKNEVEEKKIITNILKNLKSKNRQGSLDTKAIAFGLYKISTVLENSGLAFKCLGGSQADCFWVNLHQDLMDQEIWKENKNGIMTYREGDIDYAGYQTGKSTPYGVKPVGPGQDFFIKYNSRLQNNNVDPYHFNSNHKSLTDYMLKQMVCGVDVIQGEEMLSNWWISYKLGWKSPEFNAPKIQFKNDLNICRDGINNWSSTKVPGAPSFYNYIEDKNDSNKNYGGIVDLLYQEAHDDFIQNFDQWWEKNVAPQFSAVIDKLYTDYFKAEIIDERFNEVMTSENTDKNCFTECRDFKFSHKDGYAAALKQEIDTYFTYFLEPVLNDADVDLEYVEKTLTESEAKDIRSKQFKFVRSDIYEILNVISGRNTGLTKSHLISEYEEVLSQVKADVEIENENAPVNMEGVQLQALNLMFKKRDYVLRSFFRTDEEPVLNAIYIANVELLQQMTNLSEAEVSEIQAQIDFNYMILKSEFDSYTNRTGLVLAKDIDQPDENGIYKNRIIITKVQDLIEELISEMIETQKLKTTLKEPM